VAPSLSIPTDPFSRVEERQEEEAMSLQQAGAGTPDLQQLSKVLTALKEGDFSQRLPAGAEGEAREIAETLNALLDRLDAFASEMNRVTWEVGTAGMFGCQAEVEGLSGTWKELTDNLNVMAANLTGQVRDLSQVAKGIAAGNPSRRVMVDAQGETLELKQSLNTLVDQLDGRPSQHPPGR
jgi:HAMP domain-containing protein